MAGGMKKAQPLTETDRAYARTATRLKVAAAIWKLWEERRDSAKLDQQWLVDRLGSDKARVSRLLKEPGNWTLDTVADLLEAMEASLVDFRVMTYAEIRAVTHDFAGERPVSPEPRGRIRLVNPEEPELAEAA